MENPPPRPQHTSAAAHAPSSFSRGFRVLSHQTGGRLTPAYFATLEKNAVPAHTEQPGGLQGYARTPVPLSVAEIRRLFWRLVLATQQRVERILAWSTWRRW